MMVGNYNLPEDNVSNDATKQKSRFVVKCIEPGTKAGNMTFNNHMVQTIGSTLEFDPIGNDGLWFTLYYTKPLKDQSDVWIFIYHQSWLEPCE